MNRAVFFDIDGVIRHNNASKKDGCYYCLKYEDVDYIDGIFHAHKYLLDAGYKIFWVTSQGCVTEGLITEEGVHEILMNMIGDFEEIGIKIEDYQICYPSVISTIESEMSESKIKVKVDAVNKLAMVYSIDLSKSIGIGDRKSDIDAYKSAGIGISIQALTPYGDKRGDVDWAYDSPLDMKSEGTGFAHPVVLIELLREIHGCNDVPHLIRIAYNFPMVKKVWGEEYHIVNSINGNYCSKILHLRPDHISSLHYHKNKCETFTVLAGIANIENEGHNRICIKGDSILIQPKEKHRFEAVEGYAVLLETSTFHQDEDTYRIVNSSARVVEHGNYTRNNISGVTFD
jgi:histidinol phosphatase-like enzyme/quercetin dioxygenase-like cupin family protein